MEIALVAVAGLGLLLFLISYLAYILAGFKHHPVTGIISAIPVLNVVTLPSLWHVAGRKLILGFLGLLLAGGSWYFGAEQSLNNIVAKFQGKEVVSTQLSSNSQQKSKAVQSLLESNMQGLPHKALYKLTFDDVAIDKLSTLQGKTVSIVTRDSQTVEGRLMKIINTKAFLDARNIEKTVELDQIRQLSVMVKK